MGTKEGPLEKVTEGCRGWEYHVYSCLWRDMQVKTYVDIYEDKLVYTLIDLDIGTVIRSWE